MLLCVYTQEAQIHLPALGKKRGHYPLQLGHTAAYRHIGGYSAIHFSFQRIVDKTDEAARSDLYKDTCPFFI